MNQNIDKKIVYTGKFENILEINDHYYVKSKKDRLAILPYDTDSKGLLNRIGVIKDYNYIYDEYDYTLANDYINTDDGTNLVAANRILYNILKINITDAANWMYLGSLYNNLTSDSMIDLYCVNLTDKAIPELEELENSKINFRMISCSLAVTSDDMLFLSAYLRLFNFFYVNSLKNV